MRDKPVKEGRKKKAQNKRKYASIFSKLGSNLELRTVYQTSLQLTIPINFTSGENRCSWLYL